jgi:predicted Fe-S protein YdhL (DUF1289 family)
MGKRIVEVADMETCFGCEVPVEEVARWRLFVCLGRDFALKTPASASSHRTAPHLTPVRNRRARYSNIVVDIDIKA